MIIAVSALIGFAIGLVAGYMLATLGATNQKDFTISQGLSIPVLQFG